MTVIVGVERPVVTGLTMHRAHSLPVAAETVSHSHAGRKGRVPGGVGGGESRAPSMQALHDVVQRLNKLLALPKGWDGGREETVSPDAAIASLRVLMRVMDSDSLPPQIFPLPDGGIQMEWHVAGNSIEIEVSANGQDGYAVSENSDGDVNFDSEYSLLGVEDSLIELRAILSGLSHHALATRG